MASTADKMDVSSASFYALHVALQTLKERCQNLQQRLTTLEDENETLRRSSGIDEPARHAGTDNEAYLRNMVGELVRQKSQLTDHIAMVTKENRTLWSKLSKLTKENTTLGMDISKIRDAINANPPTIATPEAKTSSSNNLIRSKTFTRPTPKLRDRHPVEEADEDDLEANMSLEEISLQIINKLVEGKENFEQKCEQILDTTSSENLCFGFKGGQSAASDAAVEVSETIERCTSETTAVKEALVQQQSQLKQLIQGLRENKKPICNDCVKRQTEGPTSTTNTNDHPKSLANSAARQPQPTEKRPTGGIGAALEMDRTCPMCGKCYNKSEDFEIFQRHVEWHFIDDNELELSLDKNLDLISHTQNF